jgi:DNA polymerase-3 subunit delta
MVTVLSGKNLYLLQKYLQETVAAFSKQFGESIERFDGSELTSADGVLDAVRSVSFLEPRKLVIVRDFSQAKSIVEKIESIVEQTADTTDLLLIDQKLDKRTAFYTYLKKNCDLLLFDDVAPYDLQRWISDEAKKRGISMSSEVSRFLIERVGPNQQLLDQEILKLSLQTSSITKELVEDLVEQTPQSKVFDMLDALFTGKSEKAQQLYNDQRAQGEEPQKILAMITWQLQQLTLAVFCPDKKVDTLTRAGMSPYSAQKCLQLAKNISQKDLKFFITELASIDEMSKTNADIESALTVYFAEVTTHSTLIK